MTPAADRAATVFGGLAAAGLAVLAATRAWSAETSVNAIGVESTSPITGTATAPWTVPAALVCGAAFLAVLAAGPALRRVLAVLAGLGALGAAAGGAANLDLGPWPILLAAAGALAAAAAVRMLLRSGGWPGPSARYDTDAADGGAIAEDPAKLWNALDNGVDPSSLTITSTAAEKGRSR
jgi:hypothetical protein